MGGVAKVVEAPIAEFEAARKGRSLANLYIRLSRESLKVPSFGSLGLFPHPATISREGYKCVTDSCLMRQKSKLI
jgi:gamma-glutamylcysteine synthetase